MLASAVSTNRIAGQRRRVSDQSEKEGLSRSLNAPTSAERASDVTERLSVRAELRIVSSLLVGLLVVEIRHQFVTVLRPSYCCNAETAET